MATERGEALVAMAGAGTIEPGGTRSRACAPSAGAATWHAVWTRSHFEASVAEGLAAKSFDVFLPQIDTWSRRAGESRLIRVPMFPGYLFVRAVLDKHRYVEMLKVRGLVRVLGDGWNRPAVIPDAEIEAIQRVVTANVPVLPHAHLAFGERVRVMAGPLAGVEGVFVHDRPQRGRLVLSIQLLGRSVAVDVDGTAVVPCRTHA